MILKEVLAIYYSSPKYLIDLSSPKNLFKRIIRTIKFILKDIFYSIYQKDEKVKLRNKNLYFVNSKNTYEALFPIFQKDNNALLFHLGHGKIGVYSNYIYQFVYKNRLKYILNFGSYLKLYKTNRKRTFRIFDLIIAAIGTYEYSIKFLTKHRPNKIIFANDHLINARALALAAKSLNIETFYLQHAAVTSYFPKLIFNHAILEGENSLNAYKPIPEFCNIHLLGILKLDKYINLRYKKRNTFKIGIALGLLNKNFEVFEFYLKIRNFTKYQPIIRFHPLDNYKPDKNSFLISNSKNENIIDFIEKVDIILAGDSSIHLEATFLNRISIAMDIGATYRDYYGFVRNKMINYVKNDEIINYLNSLDHENYQNTYLKAKYYSYSVGSNKEGNLISEVSQILQETSEK